MLLKTFTVRHFISCFPFLTAFKNVDVRTGPSISVSVIKVQGCFHSSLPLLYSHRLQQLSLPQHWVRDQNWAASPLCSTNPCEKHCCLLSSSLSSPKYHPAPWFSGRVSPKSWPGWTNPFSFFIPITSQVKVEQAESGGLSHRSRSRFAMGVPQTVM